MVEEAQATEVQAATKQLNCTNCGAPVKYMEGENVLICEYCGTPTMLAGFDKVVRVEAHFMLPNSVGKEQVLANLREWMGKGFFKAGDLAEKSSIVKTDGFYLPFWSVNCRAKTFWAGMERRTRTVGSGDNKRTETYWEPRNGTFDDEINWTVYARSNDQEYFGLDAFNPGSKSTDIDWGGLSFAASLGDGKSRTIDITSGKTKFSLDGAKGLKIINGQITQDEGKSRSDNQLKEYHRSLAEKKVDRITDCDTTVHISGAELIYIPLWFIEYNYKGKSFDALVAGTTGEVVKGLAPAGKWDKFLVVAVILMLLAAALSAAGFYLIKDPAQHNIQLALYGASGLAVLGTVVYGIITAFKD